MLSSLLFMFFTDCFFFCWSCSFSELHLTIGTMCLVPYLLSSKHFSWRSEKYKKGKELWRNIEIRCRKKYKKTASHSLFAYKKLSVLSFSYTELQCTHLRPVTVHSQLMCQRNNTTAWAWGMHVSWVRGRQRLGMEFSCGLKRDTVCVSVCVSGGGVEDVGARLW